MDKLAQHFNCYRAFNRKIYKQTLSSEHVIGNGVEKYMDTVYEVKKNGKAYEVMEGKVIENKVIFLEKGGKRFILPTIYQQHLPINVKSYFDCYLKKSDTTIYRFITEPASVKIAPEKTMSLKELVEVLNPLPHSFPKVWQFIKILAIGVTAKGAKLRLCSEPETGKTANFTIIKAITNKTTRIGKPTIAKLETLFYYNQTILPDEMTSLTKTEVREVEPFFLTIADESPTFEKHSMAQKKDMNEVDITQSSCIFTYNDINSIQEETPFFDEIWQSKEAFNSRYPALYLEGKIVGEMPKLSMPQAKKILNENFEELKVIAKNLVYYFNNMDKEIHGYDRSKLKMWGRWKVNFEAVTDALDAYSESQEIFDEWLEFVNDSVRKYREKNERVEGTFEKY